MGQVLHGCATTTHAVRTAIQRSKAPLKELAARYGLNHKTVAKWRKRAFVNDAPMGPKTPHSRRPTSSQRSGLPALIEAVPYAIHIVLTDNSIQFGDMPSRLTGPTARYRLHMFDRICREHGIEHLLTKPNPSLDQ